MDDIMEKLKLLNYETEFCQKFRRDQLVRIYFSHKDIKESTETKVEYFYDIWYWLMTFPGSTKRIKKKAFNSFKTKNEALQQLVTDIRNFTGKKENVSELLDGWGERVWYIINDLLNRELIKQNFRFKQPVVPPDEELEESKDEDIGYEINTGDQVIDDATISLSKYFKHCDNLGIEDEFNKNENIETAFDEDENEMITPTVDPDIWYKEYNRVITYIDKEIDAQGNIVDSSKNNANKKLIDISPIDELMEKINDIVTYFKSVTEFLVGGGK